MNKSETISNLAAALCMAQAELKNPSLDSVNPHFKSKFASLANIRNTITAVFTKHGLSMMQNITSTERSVGCSTMLLHDSGEWMESDTIWVPVEKSNAQGFGSAATYARRYSESAFTNTVGDDDDDGNAASEPVNKVAAISGAAIKKDAFDDLTPDLQRDFMAKVDQVRAQLDAGNQDGGYDIYAEFRDSLEDAAHKAALRGLFSSAEQSTLTKQFNKRKEKEAA